jgi:fucose 4-O-acetylase-like acetyltransferase
MAIVLATYTYVFNIGTANFVNNTYDSGIFRMYSCGLAGVLAVMFISKRLTKIPLISYFGRYSIMILVTHGIVIRLIQPQLFKFHISEWWINALICTSLTLLVYLALIPLMKRYLPYVTAQKDLIPINSKPNERKSK